MDHEHTEHVAAAPDAVFAALADPANLPKFVPQMTQAATSSGDTVEVDARYDGKSQHGTAQFRADDDQRRIEWSAESGYHGWIQVDADGADRSRVTLFLHTIHDAENDHDIAGTLDAIRMLVEAKA